MSAGFVAEYVRRDRVILLYAFGITADECRADLRRQLAGAAPNTRNRLLQRVTVRTVDADEASEILEMLDAGVLEWMDVERVA